MRRRLRRGSRPTVASPCADTIERQIDRPKPKPSFFVVADASNRCACTCRGAHRSPLHLNTLRARRAHGAGATKLLYLREFRHVDACRRELTLSTEAPHESMNAFSIRNCNRGFLGNSVRLWVQSFDTHVIVDGSPQRARYQGKMPYLSWSLDAGTLRGTPAVIAVGTQPPARQDMFPSRRLVSITGRLDDIACHHGVYGQDLVRRVVRR